MRCQYNKIRLEAGIVGRMGQLGQERQMLPAAQIPGIAQIELTLSAAISASRVSGDGIAMAAMQLQQRITAQPFLMKVPSRSSRALLQFGLRVHHDRSVPSDGFPKQFP
jgi:hypothetical protein